MTDLDFDQGPTFHDDDSPEQPSAIVAPLAVAADAKRVSQLLEPVSLAKQLSLTPTEERKVMFAEKKAASPMSLLEEKYLDDDLLQYIDFNAELPQQFVQNLLTVLNFVGPANAAIIASYVDNVEELQHELQAMTEARVARIKADPVSLAAADEAKQPLRRALHKQKAADPADLDRAGKDSKTARPAYRSLAVSRTFNYHKLAASSVAAAPPGAGGSAAVFASAGADKRVVVAELLSPKLNHEAFLAATASQRREGARRKLARPAGDSTAPFCDFSPNGSLVATCGAGAGAVFLHAVPFEVASPVDCNEAPLGQLLHTDVYLGAPVRPLRARFVPLDPTRLVAGCEGGLAVEFDVEKRAAIRVFSAGSGRAVTAVAPTPANPALFLAACGDVVTLWDSRVPDTQRHDVLAATLRGGGGGSGSGSSGSGGLGLDGGNPESKRSAAAEGKTPAAPAAAATALATALAPVQRPLSAGVSLRFDHPAHAAVTAARFLRCDSHSFVTGAEDGVVRLWDLRSTGQLNVYRTAGADGKSGGGSGGSAAPLAVQDVETSASGAVVFAATARGALSFDAQSGELLQRMDHGRPAVLALALAADGAGLFTAATDGKIRLWTAQPPKKKAA